MSDLKKYIDVEELKRELICNKNFYPTIIKNALEKIPPADVVKVVRCKDCVSFVKRDGFCWCEEHSDGFGSHIVYVDEDDYCSYGERRNDK